MEQGRWVIPARSSVQLLVRFASEAVGKFSGHLTFEVVGPGGGGVGPAGAAGSAGSGGACIPLSAALAGTCDYPQVNSDPR